MLRGTIEKDKSIEYAKRERETLNGTTNIIRDRTELVKYVEEFYEELCGSGDRT